MKSSKSFLRIRIIYVATTVFLVALSVYTFIQIKNLTDTSELINHTNQVTQSLQKISTDIILAESSKRGFLLSGDSIHLRKRDSALTKLFSERSLLFQLVSDNTQQLKNLSILDSAIQKKVMSIRDIPNSQAFLLSRPFTQPNIKYSVKSMDYVRLNIDVMIAEESLLLAHRTVEYSNQSFMTPIFMIVFFLGALIILWASYLKITAALKDAHELQNKLTIQNIGIENRSQELIIANQKLQFESREKENRAAELVIANANLLLESNEKEKRSKELVIANANLLHESTEKEKRSAELMIANAKLLFESTEKENRSSELIIANRKLLYESTEKENRSAELLVANKKLLHESTEKENRAAELVIANSKLLYESNENENRSAELVIANANLLHESKEKESRAAELVIANLELAYQIEEKEKRAEELMNTNKELQLFAQIASHDLQEPLRKIQMFASRIKEKEVPNFSDTGKAHFEVIQNAAERMQILIQDLIAYAQTNNEERKFENINLNEIINDVIKELSEVIAEKGATIELGEFCYASIIPFQFSQLMNNLISNALKFSNPEVPCIIKIFSRIEKGDKNISTKLCPKKKYCHITFSDNGIGFDTVYNEKIFEIFQRLHGKEVYIGTGIGLAIVKKIIDNHNGLITAVGKPNEGATFDIYLPIN